MVRRPQVDWSAPLRAPIGEWLKVLAIVAILVTAIVIITVTIQRLGGWRPRGMGPRA